MDFKEFSEIFKRNLRVNWKQHAEAPVPPYDPNMINIYEFNKNEFEPLRNKSYEYSVEDINEFFKIYWICQDPFERNEIVGMKAEFERWFERIKNKAGYDGKAQIFVYVKCRDGHPITSFFAGEE